MRRALVGGLGIVASLFGGTSSAIAATPGRGPRSLREATSVSGNWAGYAIALPSGNARSKAFRTVSASWVVAPVTCEQGRSYSSAWIGLGGYYRASQALEQVGTQGDCSRGGRSVYSAWYELVPRAPVNLRVHVHAGDSVAARVTVNGRRVALSLRDVTTGASFSRTLRLNAPDVSSAEWIVEAPSACDDAGDCASLRLANFGTATFSAATATAANGHEGTISDPGWLQTKILLHQDFGGGRFGFASGAASATPSALSADGSSFTVSWSGASTVQPQTRPPFFFPGTGRGG
jgi:hypothetical protein